jgi:hypothetical protein
MPRLHSVKRPSPPSKPLRGLAVMRLSPDEFVASLGVRFQSGADDLDEFDYAQVVADGETFFLLRYQNSPDPGTELLGARDTDPDTAVARFLTAAGLDANDVTWKTDWVPELAPVILEPANPFDIPLPNLNDLLARVAQRLGDLVPARLALRPEVGYGVNGMQFLRMWLPDDVSRELTVDIESVVVDWLHSLWAADAAERGSDARPRGVSIFASDGTELRHLMIRGSDGSVQELPTTRALLPRPVLNDEDERSR